MLISVIITTKNEEKNIENCLKSVLAQTFSQDHPNEKNISQGAGIEIIVVDNSSTDQTKEIARKYTDKVFDQGPERSAQRNFGVEKSDGEYFIYLDADMILHKDVIKDCVNFIQNSRLEIQNSDVVALYISEIVMGKNFWSKVRRFERSFYDATVVDCARFIQKEAFQKVKGFDENLTGPEDWDLDKKLRAVGKTDLVKTPIYHNEAEFELGKYLDKKGYYAKKFDTYIAKWGKNDADIKKQFGIYYRFLGVFVENGKWKKMIAHPFLTFGMYALRFLVGLKFITRNK